MDHSLENRENFVKNRRKNVWQLFDKIAKRYDFLNHVLSFGLDLFWRRQVCRYLPSQPNLVILDLATGTADLPITICKSAASISQIIGIDMSREMLSIGRKKVRDLGLENSVLLQVGDAMQPPFLSATFDVVTVAFGIRNLDNLHQALVEMKRVVKKEGRAIILEFSMPKLFIFRSIYLFYFRFILPFIGAIISQEKQAYYYLNRSVEAFPYGNDFCSVMKTAGFVNVKAIRLTLGIASIYVGEKP